MEKRSTAATGIERETSTGFGCLATPPRNCWNPPAFPTSPDLSKNRYVFDCAITRINRNGSTPTNDIDLYKAGCFVNESKQGTL